MEPCHRSSVLPLFEYLSHPDARVPVVSPLLDATDDLEFAGRDVRHPILPLQRQLLLVV